MYAIGGKDSNTASLVIEVSDPADPVDPITGMRAIRVVEIKIKVLNTFKLKKSWRLFISVDKAYKFDGTCTGRIYGKTADKIPENYVPIELTDYICSIDA